MGKPGTELFSENFQMTLQADEVQITANDCYSGNNRYSGMKSPDRFFHYSGRCLYSETF